MLFFKLSRFSIKGGNVPPRDNTPPAKKSAKIIVLNDNFISMIL